MLRKTLIQKYINTDDIVHIIWHDSSMFFAQMLKTLLLLFVLYVLYAVVDQYVTYPHLERIFGVLWIILLVKYVLDFMNIYLDTVVISANGITFLTWDGILDYKTDFFGRESIETVSHNQDSLRDKFWGRGDIHISLNQNITFPFTNVPNPKRQVSAILQQREKSMHISNDITDNTNDNDTWHYGVIMEALGEIVQEYAQKKKRKEDDEDVDIY